MSGEQQKQEKTPQEIIGEFERKYLEKINAMNELREELTKTQALVIRAQAATMEALQQLVNYKEQYLIALVNNKQNQINALTPGNQASQPAQPAQRADNLQPAKPLAPLA